MTTKAGYEDLKKAIDERLKKLGIKEAAFLSIGGQGGVTGMEVLSTALVNQGNHIYVAASILGGRRMAPNVHTLRIADTPEIPSGERPFMLSELMVMHETLYSSTFELVRKVLSVMKSGVLMVCTSKDPHDVEFPFDFEGTIATADVASIFLDAVGIQPPPIGVAALGLYAKATGTVRFDLVREAATERLGRLRPEVREANLRALERVYEATRIWEGAKLSGKQSREEYEKYLSPQARRAYVLTGAAGEGAVSLWRESLPVCDQRKCTCVECIVAYCCPEGVIKWKDEVYTIDYNFCKGCGVCANECPRGAITMKPEKEVLASLAS